MKKMLLSLVVSLVAGHLFGQFKVTAFVDKAKEVSVSIPIVNNKNVQIQNDVDDLKEFKLQYKALANGHKLVIKAKNVEVVSGTPDEYSFTNATAADPDVTFTFQKSIINTEITVLENDGTIDKILQKFRFIKTGRVAAGVVATPGNLEPLATFLDGYFTSNNLILSQAGYVKGNVPNETHIYFDEYGNSLLGAIPQGISNRQYVAHIIYRSYSASVNPRRYSIKQKTGTYSSALSINNSGALKELNNLQGNEEEAYDIWQVADFPLGIATDDITFDIVVTSEDDNHKAVKIVLETQTIKMAPIYHATIDIGLINTELQSPTYSLVDAVDGSANKVVKTTDKSPKGVVTVMATFYTSPIVLLESLFNKKFRDNTPKYKLTGRSFFDDHAFFERIYPTLGVSVSSTSFENLFFGLNWELARGLSVFAGGHWGKVNTFTMPGFVEGVTPVTKAQYDFYTNNKWDVAWAYGAKLDIKIITNLFK
jgi:hypothetical protein